MSNVFEIAELETLVADVLAHHPAPADVHALMLDLQARLVARYPGQVAGTPSWVMSSAAGFFQPVNVLHVSLHEYLILTGTPAPASGGNGPFTVDLWDFVLEGQLDTYAAGDFAVSTHARGATSFTARGTSHAGSVKSHLWQLEYARGFVPGMWGTPLAATLFETLDYPSLVKMLGRATALLVIQWWNRVRRP